MKAVLFMNFAWHVFSGCRFVEVSRFERRLWKDSDQELGKRRRWGMMGNGTIWQPFGERSARTGCVLALRWNLDKPFSMSEPPAEYKGFLSKKPDKLGWRDERCCILWMQKNCTATMERLTLEAINTIGCHWYWDNSVVTWGSFMFGAHMPLNFTTPGVRITNQLLELLLGNANKTSIACAGALRALWKGLQQLEVSKQSNASIHHIHEPKNMGMSESGFQILPTTTRYMPLPCHTMQQHYFLQTHLTLKIRKNCFDTPTSVLKWELGNHDIWTMLP